MRFRVVGIETCQDFKLLKFYTIGILICWHISWWYIVAILDLRNFILLGSLTVGNLACQNFVLLRVWAIEILLGTNFVISICRNLDLSGFYTVGMKACRYLRLPGFYTISISDSRDFSVWGFYILEILGYGEFIFGISVCWDLGLSEFLLVGILWWFVGI